FPRGAVKLAWPLIVLVLLAGCVSTSPKESDHVLTPEEPAQFLAAQGQSQPHRVAMDANYSMNGDLLMQMTAETDNGMGISHMHVSIFNKTLFDRLAKGWSDASDVYITPRGAIIASGSVLTTIDANGSSQAAQFLRLMRPDELRKLPSGNASNVTIIEHQRKDGVSYSIVSNGTSGAYN